MELADEIATDAARLEAEQRDRTSDVKNLFLDHIGYRRRRIRQAEAARGGERACCERKNDKQYGALLSQAVARHPGAPPQRFRVKQSVRRFENLVQILERHFAIDCM